MTTTVKTTCSYCGVGCGILASRDRLGRLSVRGDPDHPVNRGQLCSKGRYLHHVVADTRDRLLHPEMRLTRDAPRERVDWDTALTRVAESFQDILRRHGPDAVALYVSGQCLTEEYYAANKLMKGFIGSNNIDTNSRLCMSSAVAGYRKSLGDDLVPASYEDLEQCSCFLIAGANPAWCHPILFRRLERHKERNPDTRMIVVDPRRTQTAALADLHLRILPGTDVLLFNAIARLLMERGYTDRIFLLEHTEGFERLREQVLAVPLAEAARGCGVAEQDLERAAEWIGQSPTFMSLWAMGLNQSANAVDKNVALINLSLLTGKIGRPGCGPFSLTGQPNAMGGREVGGLATMLAAHRDPADPSQRDFVRAFWGSGLLSPRPGLTATEMITALESGALKAVWIVCTNPVVSLPDARRVEAALARAELLVVQDISSRSQTVALADVVLPAAGWLEKSGTMTNSERRVALLPKLIDPPGEALPDTEIFQRFAARMGWGESFRWPDSAAVFAEHAALTRGTAIDMSGLSHQRLAREGSLCWPCPAEDHPGTTRLFTDGRFATPNGLARLHAVTPSAPQEPPTADFPFILTTGRIRDQWHTMTRTGKVARLRQHLPQPFLEIHPLDAAEQGITQGDVVDVTSPTGTARVRARLGEEIRRGVVFLPMHWGPADGNDWGRCNNLTSRRVDPHSKQPDFKYSRVRLSRISPPRRKVVLVGAGAACLQFAVAYRAKRPDDELVVFGREPLPFYNRVLLPDYITRRHDWEALLTADEDTMRDLRIDFRRGVEIASIDRARRVVRDTEDGEESYDLLVLGTGSRPFVPPGIPLDLPGIFTLRSRADADRIMTRVRPGAHALIIGGGLLGLEAAASLLHLGLQVSVVEMGLRLMLRQLDALGGELLREELEERGVRVLCDDAVVAYEGRDRVETVRTKSGLALPADLVLVAVGTRPNLELARDSGIECRRGVVVNDHLQTSDPEVYAIGEIAEHRGQLYGITPTANEQADVAAGHASGDPWALYDGSVLFNILKIQGVDVCSAGLTETPSGDTTYEEVVFLDRRKRVYKKCISHRGRLVGAILIGDKAEFPAFLDLIRSGIELEDQRDTLLRGGNNLARPRGKLVCVCNSVGEDDLRDHIQAGCRDLPTLCQASRAGTGCGSCKPELKALLTQLAPAAV